MVFKSAALMGRKFHRVLRKGYSKSKAGKAPSISKENADNGHVVQLGIEVGDGQMMTEVSGELPRN